MILPFVRTFIQMYKYHLMPIYIEDSFSIFIVKIFWSTYFYINPKMNQVEIRCPYSWSFIFIPDEYRLFIRPSNPKFFQYISNFSFSVLHSIINRFFLHNLTSKKRKKKWKAVREKCRTYTPLKNRVMSVHANRRKQRPTPTGARSMILPLFSSVPRTCKRTFA